MTKDKIEETNPLTPNPDKFYCKEYDINGYTCEEQCPACKKTDDLVPDKQDWKEKFEAWQILRTKALSEMFDRVNKDGIYPTSKFYETIDKYFLSLVEPKETKFNENLYDEIINNSRLSHREVTELVDVVVRKCIQPLQSENERLQHQIDFMEQSAKEHLEELRKSLEKDNEIEALQKENSELKEIISVLATAQVDFINGMNAEYQKALQRIKEL